MKKGTKNLLIALVIVLSIGILLQWGLMLISYIRTYGKIPFVPDIPATAKAVVVKVNENSICAMGIDGILTGLFFVGFSDEGNIGFKQGQEILITWEGSVLESYPAQIGKADRIKILKEKSEREIPEEYLKYCYSSENNVKVTIEEFTNESLGITIVDTNELPYEYTTNYTIYKKVKNNNYTGIGQKIGEDTENSIAGFTGIGSEYVWEEMPKKIGSMLYRDAVEDMVYNLPNIVEGEHYEVKGWKLNYSKIYGKLDEGEYYLTLKAESFWIKIDFTIDANGKVNYNEPSFEL